MTAELTDLFARVAGDPLLAYALLAAGVLAVASAVGGIASGDLRSLARAETWIAAALAAIAALALVAAGDVVQAGDPDAWPLPGIRKLPLYLFAIGYGPLPAALAAAMFAGVERLQGPFPAAEAVLLLESAAVGWLAIAPSPRKRRWAASLAVVAGWAMATASAGTAALAWLHRPLEADLARATLVADLPGVAAAAVLAAFLPPSWWRGAAPGSWAQATGGEPAGPRIPPMRRPRSREAHGRMEAPPVPEALSRNPTPRRRADDPPVPSAMDRATGGGRDRGGSGPAPSGAPKRS